MATIISIGQYIKSAREERGITQWELCDGVCDSSTISRIENGKNVNNSEIINRLMEKLGLPDPREFYILSGKEKKIDALKKEIVFYNSRMETEPALEKLRELEDLVGKNDKFVRQLSLRTKALVMPVSYDEKLAMLDEAIRLTVPHFDVKNIDMHLYCLEELKIIVNMASVYGQSGQHKIALSVFDQLLDYVEEHYPHKVHSGAYLPLITHNYAIELGRCKLYDDSNDMAEQCKEYCIKYGHYESLPGAVSIMAENYFFMGKYEESKERYRAAYYGYKLTENETELKRLVAEAHEHFGDDLEF